MLAVLFVAALAAGQNAQPVDGVQPAPPAPEVQSRPPAAPRDEAPPAAREPGASAPLDTLYFVGGGRVRGTVLEETPRHDVTIRLLDGTVRRYDREELARIEYADGSVSRRRVSPRPAPEPPTYEPEPPRAEAYPPSRPEPYPPPPAPEPAYARPEAPALVPFWGSFGLGANFFAGRAETGFSMSDVLEPQLLFSIDGGVRLTPAIGLGIYADLGVGDPAESYRTYCAAQGIDCSGITGRFGFQLRHTWDPVSPAAKWLAVGTGWEIASVATDSGHPDPVQYTGREYVRLAGGVDLRSSSALGVGLYGAVSLGEFRHLQVLEVPTSVDGALHTTFQAGVRLTLFP
ncbi:hypothetical protein [Anaeromyxobacter oryzisoli]|uniref:hypothetical protein n=1 Tax=Anaeromyxobacter oryzisoli TaxID=2925408 RepID=UPI001F58054A|nr:hypothetical protein [Anaeromyxobacter sp. SG63]